MGGLIHFHNFFIYLKVLGITPFAAYTRLSTKELCKQIMRSMKALHDCYHDCYHSVHMQRKFAQSSPSATQRGEFFKSFTMWLQSGEGGHPSDEGYTENASQESAAVQHTASQSSRGHWSDGSSQGNSFDGAMEC